MRPALGRLDRVGGAEDQQVGHRAQGGHVLDRLVGRAVLAQADGVVGHHVDHADAHQRGQTDRRAAVVGEDQEGAAVGDDAAVQRHAVHRRGHAVLAHAVMDVAAGVVVGASTAPVSLTVVLLEPVRSAEPPIIPGSPGTSTSSTAPERRGWPASACRPTSFGVEGVDRRVEIGAAARRRRRDRTRAGAGAGGVQARFPVLALRRAAPAGGCARRRRFRSGMTNGSCGQPSFSRAAAISSSPSGEPWRGGCRPWSGAPLPMMVLQAISDGRSVVRAQSSAAAIGLRIVAVDRRLTSQPAALKRASWSLGLSDGRRRRW